MKKRFIFCLAISLVFILSLGVSAEKTVIRHSHDVYNQRDWTAWLEAAKLKFEALNPDIEIEIIVHGRNEQREKFLLTHGMEEGADVMEVLSSDHYNLATVGLFDNIDPFIENDSEISWEDFLPIAAQCATMFDGPMEGGHWFLPMSLWVIGAAFNDTHFQESGMQVPSRYNYTWTWDDFADIGRKLLRMDAAGNVTRWGATYSHWRTWIHNAGGFMYEPYINPTQITMNTEAVRQALEFLQRVTSIERIAAYHPYPEPFTAQEISIFLHAGPSITPILRRNNVNWEWSFGPNPKLERAGSEIVSIGFAISSGSSKKEAAWRWIKFLATEAAADHIMVTGRPAAWLHAVADYQAYFPMASPWEYVWIELLSDPDSYIRPIVDDDVGRIINDHVWSVIRGEVAPEVGIARAQEQASTMLQLKGLAK